MTRWFGGDEVASRQPAGPVSAGAGRLDGLVLRRGEAWGKHLLVRFDDLEERVHVHRGSTARSVTDPREADDPVPEPVGQVRWRLVSGTGLADLRGPTACELLARRGGGRAARPAGAGTRLRADAEPERAWERIHRSRSAVATLLMDQSVVAGIDNV